MEQWKTVVGYEGFYEVSDHGRMRSVDRVIEHPCNGPTRRKGMVRRPTLGNHGYLAVTLSGGGKRVTMLVHHLVLSAFVGPCPDGYECNHRSGKKTDNRVENLEWVTSSENKFHAYATGLNTHQGEAHPLAKLTWGEVEKIRELYASGEYAQHEIGDRFGVRQTTISAVITGRTWAGASEEAEWEN